MGVIETWRINNYNTIASKFKRTGVVNNFVLQFGGARLHIMADVHDMSPEESVDEL